MSTVLGSTDAQLPSSTACSRAPWPPTASSCSRTPHLESGCPNNQRVRGSAAAKSWNVLIGDDATHLEQAKLIACERRLVRWPARPDPCEDTTPTSSQRLAHDDAPRHVHPVPRALVLHRKVELIRVAQSCLVAQHLVGAKVERLSALQPPPSSKAVCRRSDAPSAHLPCGGSPSPAAGSPCASRATPGADVHSCKQQWTSRRHAQFTWRFHRTAQRAAMHFHRRTVVTAPCGSCASRRSASTHSLWALASKVTSTTALSNHASH